MNASNIVGALLIVLSAFLGASIGADLGYKNLHELKVISHVKR